MTERYGAIPEAVFLFCGHYLRGRGFLTNISPFILGFTHSMNWNRTIMPRTIRLMPAFSSDMGI